MCCHVLSFLCSSWIPTNIGKVEKTTRRSHFDAYTPQILKISRNHQTTERLPNHVLPCSKLPFSNFNSNKCKKSEKCTRRSRFDAYAGQIVKISIITNRNAFQIMFCHVLSFFFSTLFPRITRKVKKVPVGAIMMHIHGKSWRLAHYHQTTETPSKPCFDMF